MSSEVTIVVGIARRVQAVARPADSCTFNFLLPQARLLLGLVSVMNLVCLDIMTERTRAPAVLAMAFRLAAPGELLSHKL